MKRWRANNAFKEWLHRSHDEIIKETFESLQRKEASMKSPSMKGSNFVFDSVQLLYYKCHKKSFKRSGSYVESPDWTKRQESNNESEDKVDRCFQYAATITLNFDKIKKYLK